MNIGKLLILWVFCLGGVARAQLVGDSASIGANNLFQSGMSGMMAIGSSNEVLFSDSLAIGISNVTSAQRALAVGDDNTIYSDGWTTDVLTIGYHNFTMGSELVSIGDWNSLPMDGETGVGAYTSVCVGMLMNNMGMYSLMVGMGNQIPLQDHIEYNFFSAQNCALIGQYLVNRYDNCLVVGKNNSSPVLPPAQLAPLFVIGNGSLTAPANALTVDQGGNIKINGIITAATGGSIPEYTGP